MVVVGVPGDYDPSSRDPGNYGPRPLIFTRRHGLSLNSTCGIRLSDMRHGGKKIETWLFLEFDMSHGGK